MPDCVAIVDYGMGNLFSVQAACEAVGLNAKITAAPRQILDAAAVILPGVGALPDAMQALRQRDLVPVLREAAAQGKPFMGICLGLQLLMSESEEFGRHEALGLIPGTVVQIADPKENGRALKVPHIGWNELRGASRDWTGSLLAGVTHGEQMYFVHSFVARPEDPALSLSTTRYGGFEFCSSLQKNNIFGCQFHPERSGPQGLHIYRNFAASLDGGRKN